MSWSGRGCQRGGETDLLRGVPQPVHGAQEVELALGSYLRRRERMRVESVLHGEPHQGGRAWEISQGAPVDASERLRVDLTTSPPAWELRMHIGPRQQHKG